MIVSKTKTNNVNYSINEFMKANRDDYSYAHLYAMASRLKTIAHDLHTLGYGLQDITKIKNKHIEALVGFWKEKPLSVGTIKNRMADMRFVCERSGRKNVVKSNQEYDIGKRQTVGLINRAINNIDLDSIHDAHLKVSIRLQKAFGLRREECLKIIPSIADCGNHLRLKGSWTKGNIERTIFIRTEEQRQALDAAKLVAGCRSLIPENRTYIFQRCAYDRTARNLGHTNLHGLRYAFAQRLYKEYTGWECPFNGGKNRKMMSDAEKRIDKDARELISLELGHSRLEITKVYLG